MPQLRTGGCSGKQILPELWCYSGNLRKLIEAKNPLIPLMSEGLGELMCRIHFFMRLRMFSPADFGSGGKAGYANNSLSIF